MKKTSPKYEKKNLNKDFLQAGVSSSVIAGVILLSMIVFCLMIFAFKKINFQTEAEKQKNNMPVEVEETVQSNEYTLEFSKEEDFYNSKWIIHDGIFYRKCSGIHIADISQLGECLGTTNKSIEYSSFVTIAYNGNCHRLSSGQKYYAYPEDDRFLILENSLNNEEGYQAFVNEDFYEFFAFYDNFQTMIDNKEDIIAVSLERYSNTDSSDIKDMPRDMYMDFLELTEIKPNMEMRSTDSSYTVQTNVHLTLKNHLVLTYMTALHKTEEHPLFWYCDITGDSSLNAFVYQYGKDKSMDEKILSYFWPDYQSNK